MLQKTFVKMIHATVSDALLSQDEQKIVEKIPQKAMQSYASHKSYVGL